MIKMRPVAGDTRIKWGFLLFPKVINSEMRWLVATSWYEWYTGWTWIPDCWED